VEGEVVCPIAARTVSVLTAIAVVTLAASAVVVETRYLGGASGPPPLDATTSRSGTDDLTALPCGTTSSADVRGPDAQADVPEAEEAATESSCDDEPEPPSTFSVPFFCRVVSAGDCRPIVGAKVAVFSWLSDGKPESILRTDATGLFTHPGGGRPDHVFEIAPQGYESLRIDGSGSHRTEAEALVVQFRPEAVLVGRVTDSHGRPRPGLAVLVRPHTAGIDEWEGQARMPSHRVAETDRDGAYRLTNLSGLATLRVALASDRDRGVFDGYRLRLATRFVQLHSGEERRIDFRLPDGSTLSGRVVDRDRRPVTKAKVWITDCSSSLIPPRIHDPRDDLVVDADVFDDVEAYTATDAAGRYRFPSMPVGDWRVEIGRERGPAGALVADRIAPCSVSVSITGDVPEVVQDLPAYRGHSMDLRVVDHLGAAVPGATVCGSRRPSGDKIECHVADVSEENGAALLGPLVPGEYEIRAYSPDRSPNLASNTIVARDGDLNVLLRLPPGCLVSGRIKRPRSPRGHDGLQRVTAISRESDHEVSAWIKDEAFSLPALRPETYDLFVLSGDGTVGVRHGLHPTAGRRLEIPAIDCHSRGGKILIHIEGMDGVRCWSREMTLDVLDSDGLRIRRMCVHGVPMRLLIPVGEVRFVLRADGAIHASRTASVTADGITRVRLTMR
jgi:hypothetical protein